MISRGLPPNLSRDLPDVAIKPLSAADQTALGLADVGVVRGALGNLAAHAVPPWLAAANPFQDGSPPRGLAQFAAVTGENLLELIAVRGPLHVMDGWSYVARALSAIVSGDPHAARHLAYYGELRAALSILASSGIGIFNRRNAVIGSAGDVHVLAERPTHDMCWATISGWAQLPDSLRQMVEPLRIGAVSFLDPFQEFFPSGASAAASYVMTEWGFDLAQGAEDSDQRNWSSYQPTAFADIATTPADDAAFLAMFWEALRPGSVILERQLLRILLEAEARVHGDQLYNYEDSYNRLDESLKTIVPFDFLTRVIEPVDHEFLIRASQHAPPAHPYSMVCRAALLLRLATGMGEANLAATGVEPAVHFDAWWREFGRQHGLWPPEVEPESSLDLWQDVDAALEDIAGAPTINRHGWISSLAGSALRVCETERAALWGLFQ